jgi:hypothetical protein
MHWGQAIAWWPNVAFVFHPALLSRPIIGGKGQFCALLAQKAESIAGDNGGIHALSPTCYDLQM